MSEIRRAELSDLAGIAALWNRAIRETTITFTTEEKSPQALAPLAAGGRLLVMDTGGLAGFGALGPFRAGPGYRTTGELTIFLADDARGRGLGARLLAAIEDRARADGLHALVAAVSGENAAAVRFFARQGYTETGRMPQVGRKFGRYLDLVLLQRFLPPTLPDTSSGG